MKVIMTADSHLNKYYSKMSPDTLMKRRKYLLEGFKKVVDIAISNDVDLFLHGGDLFDMPDPRMPPIAAVARNLIKLKNNGIKPFLIVGNHDMPRMRTSPGGASPQSIFSSLEGVHVFTNSSKIETERIKIGEQAVSVSCLSFNPLLNGGEDPLKDKDSVEKEDISFFLTHYGVEDHLAGRVNDPTITHSSIDRMGIDYFCAGHIHKPAHFKIGETNVIVPGATERMNFGEIDRRTGFYIIDTEENPQVQFKEIKPQGMREKEVVTTELPEVNPTEYLLNIVQDNSQDGQLFKLKLKGVLTRENYHKLNLREINRTGKNENFFFDLSDEVEFESEDILSTGGGRLSQIEELEKVAESFEKEAEDEEKKAVRKARNLVTSYYEGE